MIIKLKKRKFARNRSREKDIGDFFNKTSSGLTSLLPLIITVFFTPALIATSIFSKEIIVALANITLSLGYLTNFFYRLYKKEMSKSELLVSSLTLALFFAVFFILFPPVTALTALSILGFINQLAVVINGFFLIKHVLVPPVKRFIENIAQRIGFDISGHYFSKPLLKLTHDRFAIDRLLVKNYGHDSFSPEFNPQEIENFNNLLTKLIEYINKYDESIFGYLTNKEAIHTLEKQISQLTIQGNTDSSHAFISQKISFKTTKLRLLQAAEKTVTDTLQHPDTDQKTALRFFSHPDLHKKHKTKPILDSGLKTLQEEIKRQQEKLDSLRECLPSTSRISL